MCGMSPPVERSITVSAPYLRQARSFTSSPSTSLTIWLLPMFALILHLAAMPMAIGSSSGWFKLAGMIIRPQATSLRTSSAGTPSRRATCSISSVTAPCRAKCICVTFARPRRLEIHSARMAASPEGLRTLTTGVRAVNGQAGCQGVSGFTETPRVTLRVCRSRAAPAARQRLFASGLARSALQLGHDPLRPVDPVERLEQRRRADRDGAVDRRIEPVLAAQRLDVPVEDEADHLQVLVEDGRSGVTADDVVGGRHVERGPQVDPFVLVGDRPALRERERLAAGGALEGAAHHGDRVHPVALLLVPLDRAVAQAQREGRVGVVARPLDAELHLGDLLRSLLLGRLDHLVVPLAHCARLRLGELRQLDEGVAGSVDGRFPAIPQLPAQLDVLELGAGDQLLG